MTQTIASLIICPDGTKLYSRHRHDYQTHRDANGEEYMIDGGLNYTRRSVNKVEAQHHTITMDDPHHIRREHFAWGSYGKDGRQPLRWIPLEDMETEHIEAVLATCNPAPWTEQLFKDELEWRSEH